MKTILICTDGSAYSASVYEYAAWAAKRGDYAVHVLHVLAPKGKGSESEEISPESPSNQAAEDHGNRILEDARKALLAAGVEKVTTDLHRGDLADALVLLADRIEFVIVGKRGETADLLSPHFGSNLERVIRTSPRPVWVAPRTYSPIERFLIAYDGGPSAQKAVSFIMEQALLKDLDCHMVQAGKLNSDEEWDLQEMAARLGTVGFSVKTHHIPGPADTVITDTLKKEGLQLLVMGAYGHSKIREFLIGSTTSTLIREAALPILMFR